MKQEKDFREGFSTPAAMILIFSFCIIIMSLAFFSMTKQKKINTYKKIYIAKRNSENILENIVRDFQVISKEKVDTYQSDGIQDFLSKYIEYEINIEDVSTKINEEFLPNRIYKSKEIQDLLFVCGESIKTEYGWINSKISDSEKIEEIKKDFEEENISPIVNNLPLYNIYFMDENFLKAICSLTDISTKWSELSILLQKLDDTQNLLTVDEISNILGISKSHLFFSFVGTKTTFWKITFSLQNCDTSAILAAIPDNENKISEYRLIEKNIQYLGGMR